MNQVGDPRRQDRDLWASQVPPRAVSAHVELEDYRERRGFDAPPSSAVKWAVERS